MIEVFDLLRTNAYAFLVVCAFGVMLTLMLMLILMQLKTAARSHYLEQEHRAVLSKMRESYEAQLAKISMEMTATRTRWEEVNHLLLDAQRKGPFADRPTYQSSLAQTFGVAESSLTVDPKLVFYLTPFSIDELHTFNIVKQVCDRSGLTCLRGDETNNPINILSHIVSMILKARLVIANISSRNANVMYELGIAHSAGKPVILISKTLDAPFDIAVNRIILYENDDQLEKSLSASMLNVLSSELTRT
jgi:heme exporter protein D